eukprot:8748719-Heterocapsa_arctica.AAC.1
MARCLRLALLWGSSSSYSARLFLTFSRRIPSRASSATGGLISSESDESDEAESDELSSGCFCGF